MPYATVEAVVVALFKPGETVTPMLASSGFISRLDAELCTSCGICVAFCQFDALQNKEGIITIDESHCLGCGVCVSKCKEGARWLERDPSRGEPLDIRSLAVSL